MGYCIRIWIYKYLYICIRIYMYSYIIESVDIHVYVCMLMDRLYVRIRWWACVAVSAVHRICSAPGVPSMTLSDPIYIWPRAYIYR
jgi:hypothetical protein